MSSDGPSSFLPVEAANTIDAAPDGVVVIDDLGLIRYTNEMTAKLFGRSPASLLGQPITTLIPERYHDVHDTHTTRFLAAPSRRQMGEASTPLYGLRSDGHEFPVEISLSPITVNDKPAVMASVRDVSERVALQRERLAIQQSLAESFRGTFEDAPVPMFLTNMPDSGEPAFSQVNAAWEEFLGYTREELLGRPVLEFLRADARPTSGTLASDTAQGLYETEQPYVHRDGTTRWGALTSRTINFEGAPVRLNHVADITRRVEAESERDRREAQLALLAEIRRLVLTEENLRRVLGFITEAGRNLLGAAAVTIAMPAEEGQLRIVAGATADGRTPARALVPIEGTFIGEVFTTGERMTSVTSPANGTVGERVAEPLRASDDRIEGVLVAAPLVEVGAFTPPDIDLVAALALEAGVALELDRVREDRRRLLVVADRERIARDLHDVVIQRLFASGMRLQSALGTSHLDTRVNEVVDDLDDTIRAVRNTIFQLTSSPSDLQFELELVMDRYRTDKTTVTLSTDGDIRWIPDDRADHLPPVLNELLSNATRHGGASEIDVHLRVDRNRRLQLEVVDNGTGLEGKPGSSGGLGLGNLTERAYSLHGTFDLSPGPVQGAVAIWSIPLT